MDEKNVFPLGKIPSNKQKAVAPTPAPRAVPESNPAMERQFVEGASTHSVPVASQASDWRALDPDVLCKKAINVRFNEFELGLLHHLADLQDRSLHQTVKRLLIPAARQLLAELEAMQDAPSSMPRPSRRGNGT